MKKIPTCFERDWDGDRSRVLDVVHEGCDWVFEGEGVATRKYDGTCVMMDDDGAWWARREVREGKEAPAGFVASESDSETGKIVGWEPITQSSFFKWFSEALKHPGDFNPGTYELIGPKVNGNPEVFSTHCLVPHAKAPQYEITRTFEGMRDFLERIPVEGIVFHHPDGRMAKIKGRDFGLKRGATLVTQEG